MEPGRLRLLEPADSSPDALLQRLIDGSYDKPFIEDCGPLRFLHFTLDNVQSAMRHDDPDALCLAYTRKMMAFLLFNPAPRRILQLGLGGGSLAKFCYRHLPATAIQVLEIDSNVLALRSEFHVPANDRRFRVTRADAVKYLARPRASPREDVILADACDAEGIAPDLQAPAFYPNVLKRLAPHGVLVMNVCGTEETVESHAARIRGVFGTRVVSLPAKEDGNLIVLCFKGAMPNWGGAQLDRHARQLQERFGLALPRYVRQMRFGRV